MLQVSSGILRGVPLRAPTGKQTRPSTERLRQGTFNVLRHFRWAGEDNIVSNAVIIDLFAGTGAWGIEALSNGAREAWFVESHAAALKTLQENLVKISKCYDSQSLEQPAIEIVRRDVAVAYTKLPATRLMFCDPPYECGWFERVLKLEDESGRLTPGGVFLYEAAIQEEIPAGVSTLKHFDTKNYGDSAVHFFVKRT